MPERSEKFDTALVRDDWDSAADAYAEGQATGRDYYRRLSCLRTSPSPAEAPGLVAPMTW